jgi:hypothetical protein
MILTVDELRQHVDFPTGSDADDALQRLLDASEADIVRAVGAPGAVTEYVDGGWTTLITSRPIASLTSVTLDFDGTPLAVETDDYRFTTGGQVLHRLATGTNPGYYWSGKVEVIYTPADDEAIRAAVQVDLIRLALSVSPGLTGRTIGDWSETYAANSAYNPDIARELILSRLSGPPGMVVI